MSVELKLTGHDKGFGSGFVVRRLLPVKRNASFRRPTTGRHRRCATYRVKPNSYPAETAVQHLTKFSLR